MIFNQHLRAADESVEIRFNSSGDSACFYIKDGSATMFENINDLVKYVYFGTAEIRKEYFEESDLEGLYSLEAYSFDDIVAANKKSIEAQVREQEVNAAREVLKKNGYFVDNLWHISDVQKDFNVTRETAYEILSVTLDSDYHKERVNSDIYNTGRDLGYQTQN
jgi:hypothetical protein